MNVKRKVETRTVYIAPDAINLPKGRIGGEPGKDFVRKSDLIDGEYYYGDCRNASCARWSSETQEFRYVRIKFGSRFDETIKHPEDDDGSDLFVPFFRCYPSISDLVDGDVKEKNDDDAK